MKHIHFLIVAGLLFALTASLAPAEASPVHLINRLRLGYDDNVYQSDGEEGRPAKKDSFRIIEELEILLNLNYPRTYFGLRYRPSFIWYTDRDRDDLDFFHNLDANFIHRFSPSVSLSLSDTLRYSQLPELEDEGFTIREIDDNLMNSFVATLSYNIRPVTRLDLSGRSVILRYLDSAQYVKNNNYYGWVGGLTLRQQLASLTTVSVDGRYQRMLYNDAPAHLQRDSTSLFGGLGLEQTFVPQLIGQFRAGVEHRSYDLDDFGNETSPYAELSLTFMPSPATRLTTSASYSIFESDVARYMSQTRTYLSQSLAHDFTARLSLYLSAAYAHNSYDGDYQIDWTAQDRAEALPGTVFENNVDGTEKALLFSVRLAYRVNRINWIEAGWQYTKLDSDIMGRVSYDRNRIDVGWKIQLF